MSEEETCKRCASPRHLIVKKNGVPKLSRFCLKHLIKEREYKRGRRLSVMRYQGASSYSSQASTNQSREGSVDGEENGRD